jgi:hypothetical protein
MRQGASATGRYSSIDCRQDQRLSPILPLLSAAGAADRTMHKYMFAAAALTFLTGPVLAQSAGNCDALKNQVISAEGTITRVEYDIVMDADFVTFRDRKTGCLMEFGIDDPKHTCKAGGRVSVRGRLGDRYTQKDPYGFFEREMTYTCR